MTLKERWLSAKLKASLIARMLGEMLFGWMRR